MPLCGLSIMNLTFGLSSLFWVSLYFRDILDDPIDFLSSALFLCDGDHPQPCVEDGFVWINGKEESSFRNKM